MQASNVHLAHSSAVPADAAYVPTVARAWVGWALPGSGRGAPYPGSQRRCTGACVMAWVVLIVSGVFESVWAVALGKSAGLTRLWPTIVFAAALVVSMGGLAIAMKSLPTGTSYAVWVSVGAALTVSYSMITGDESISIVKIVLLLGLIGCVVGLKLAH